MNFSSQPLAKYAATLCAAGRFATFRLRAFTRSKTLSVSWAGPRGTRTANCSYSQIISERKEGFG